MSSNFKFFCDALKSAGLEPRSYSGRGMFGKECVGAICGESTLAILDVIEEAIGENDDPDATLDLIKELRRFRTDSMGRTSMIMYWPHMTWEGGEES